MVTLLDDHWFDCARKINYYIKYFRSPEIDSKMKVLLFENWQKTSESDPSEGLLFTMVRWNFDKPYFLATLNVKVDASTTISFLGRWCESKKQSKFYAAAKA